MEFSVGYQLAEPGGVSFVEVVREYRDRVAEVYFSWPETPSGRSRMGYQKGRFPAWGWQRLETDLRTLRDLGVGLDLLLNASCYGGGQAISRALEREVLAILTSLEAWVGGAGAVATASPAIAFIVKRARPRLEVRASVNLRIATVEGLEYLADVFDGYYVSRDANRDLRTLQRLKGWADRMGKRLYFLANSGCLRHGSGQTFHDNLVAHDEELAQEKNLPRFFVP